MSFDDLHQALRIVGQDGRPTAEGWMFFHNLTRSVRLDTNRTITSLADLTDEERDDGRSLIVSDRLRSGLYVWDPTVTPAQAAADPESLTLFAPVPGQAGAWVNPMADMRMGGWANSANPARRARFAAGVFTGDNAVKFLGATAGNNGATEFWVHDLSRSVQPNGARWWVDSATNIYERDNFSGINSSFVSRGPASGGNNSSATIAVLTAAVGRSSSALQAVWAQYIEAVADVGHAGPARGIELNIVNKTSADDADKRIGMSLAAGGDPNVHGDTFECGPALRIVNNGAPFRRGVSFGEDALTGSKIAVGMWYGQGLSWLSPDATEKLRVQFNGGNASKRWLMEFTDGAMTLTNDGKPMLSAVPVADAVNGLEIAPAATGSAPAIRAVGTDTDVHLALTPKGTGGVVVPHLRVGSNQVVGARRTGWTAATGTATRTTFATGSVTLPQLAERVKALLDDLIAHGLVGT